MSGQSNHRPGLQEDDKSSSDAPDRESKTSTDELLPEEKTKDQSEPLHQENPAVAAREETAVRNHRTSRHMNFVAESDSEEEESEEDSIDRPGAFRISGIGRAAMGTTVSVDTTIYSGVGPHQGNGNNPNPEQLEAQDEQEDVAILDAYVPGQGRNQSRGQRNTQASNIGVVVEARRKSYTKWVVGFSLFLVTATLITSMVLLFNDDKDGGPVAYPSIPQAPSLAATTPLPTEYPSVTPLTTAPSTVPTSSLAPTSSLLTLVINEIRRQFQSPTLESDLRSPFSPQYRAAVWMAEEDRHAMTQGVEFPLNDDESILQFRQRYALVVLYYSTNGDSWSERCGFMNEYAHVCNWKCDWDNVAGGQYVESGFAFLEYMGVNCDSQLRVLGLDLVNNNLSGSLPEEIQGLDNIVSLHLQENNIGGSIPWMAFNNTYLHRKYGDIFLTSITLFGNQLTGTIHEDLGLFTNLTLVWLQDNLISGELPSFSKYGPPPLFGVFLRGNMLHGTIPARLFQIQSLRFFELDGNMLSGTLPDIINLPTLEILSLRYNDLSGTIPDAIGSCTDLTILDLEANQLSGTILPASMAMLTSLNLLYLHDNQLTGIGLNWSVIGGMKDLQYLIIGGFNDISGTIPTQIAELQFLETLSIGYFPGETPRTTSMTGTLPTELGNLQSLQHLDTAQNNFFGTIPTEFGKLQSLKWLFLKENWGLTGIIPSELQNLTNLGALSVQNTNLVGNFTALCDVITDESNFEWRLGLRSNCLEDDVYCDCCLLCCDDSGFCRVPF